MIRLVYFYLLKYNYLYLDIDLSLDVFYEEDLNNAPKSGWPE